MLKEIRAYLRKVDVNAVVIAHDDAFQNENLSPANERLAYVTGFTGSAGLAIITPRQAVLFVDGRYVEQAKKQTSFKVVHVPRQTTVMEWFTRFLKPNYVVAYDPFVHTVAQIDRWSEAFTKRGAKLVPFDQNPVDRFWVDRPAEKTAFDFVYPMDLAGKTTRQKTNPVKKFLKENNLDGFVVSNPDTVSWLLNKRSNAIAYAPVYLGRVMVMSDGRVLDFTPENAQTVKGLVMGFDPETTPVKVKQELIENGASVRGFANPFAVAQSCKNAAELEGMRKACLMDSAALCQYFCWLEKYGDVGSEFSVLRQLDIYRRENVEYKEPSFAPISAVGSNAALPHYQAEFGKDKKLKGHVLYLLDSGGQYWGGTTDITRTVALDKKKITKDIKARYTQVLKGHIALASAQFPKGTTGANLDVLARQYLWEDGVDYDHGTGHGVGCFLNVHESPPNISRHASTPLMENQIVTNEPGFYQKGKFGIRTENMLLVKKAAKKGWLSFEVLTFVPLCDELMDMKRLTLAERAWIGAYYRQIMDKIGLLVDEKTFKWLEQKTQKWMQA